MVARGVAVIPANQPAVINPFKLGLERSVATVARFALSTQSPVLDTQGFH